MLRRGALAVAATGSMAAAVGLAVDPRARDALLGEGGTVTWGALSRFARTSTNVVVTAADYKLSLAGLDKERDAETYKTAMGRANRRAAARLYKLCHAHGGLYTKFGQSVANLNHALPKEFTDALTPLQDRAREMPPEMALAAVERSLGRPIQEVFSEFNPKALAAASLAQVHVAKLQSSGESVAVKVQYPYLEHQTRGDMATLKLLSSFLGYWFPEFSYTWLTPEFENNVLLELDFEQEARNADRIAHMFQHRMDVHVPRVHWPLTSKRLLVMEYVDCIKVTDLERMEDAGVNPLEVAATVSSVFGDMTYVHGFVHCDPHPGNLGVLPVQPTLLGSAAAKLSALGYASVPLVLGASAVLAAPGSTVALAAGALTVGLTALSGLAAVTDSRSSADRTAHSDANGKPYKLVVFDHGMYRRLDPDFRLAYCLLWRSLLLRDVVGGRKAALQLGVDADQYDALSMIFTFRGAESTQTTGERMSKTERAKVRERYKGVTAMDINEFLQRLPRDLLFVSRCTNIVRSINLSLGGTTRLRFKLMGESAVRGLLVANPELEALDAALDAALPIVGPYEVNRPVASEVVDVDTISWHQRFEMWRLRAFLELIDNSWGVLATLIKLL